MATSNKKQAFFDETINFLLYFSFGTVMEFALTFQVLFDYILTEAFCQDILHTLL